MKTVFQDIRFAIRQLIKMPGFTLTAIVSLALGIGATTAVFSVVYAILMDPYPYKAPGSHDSYATARCHRADLNGFGVTGTQWQELRKSPVVEDTFLEDDWKPDRYAAAICRRMCRRLSQLERLQLSGRARRARTRLATLRCDRRPGSATGRRAELQVLAAAFQRRSSGSR